MGKPSIFSNQYRSEMRKRRNRIILTIIAVIIVVVVGIIVISNNWTKNNSDVKNISQGSSNKNQNTAVNKDASKIDEKQNSDKKQEEKSEKIFTVNIADGKVLNIKYDDSSNVKKITNIQNQDSDIDFNINPSGTFAVAYEKSKQSLTLINANGTSSDITNTSYTSSNGKVFTKDSILAQKNNYIWQQLPKFIDDENIAYISQLPWLNKANKYIWKYNIKDKTNTNTNITGENIQINNIVNGKGLEVIVDNITGYLKGDGSLSN
ncbi:hypothetical protein CPAST_c26810 [Clostridium pasteurianum DSM 525 = ATCC 6013]|uniref:Uncharacterized protein n=1 Tax=Clostridium pasteurianum DSM 525 = ATCC 6013 TaxID=1262449 RepID=A0A0H3J9H8_CLOPA|nr:hypothetical protein [Clostridium pasteurianum]AJA48748.1 hypothetical protein CPAST_c26810 [Clostridium pasteurianum DSM 525 = ATCC 6013]AJA52736.1 hypothetical protein CLPA_c26810 [Clostridium pasteurianum DSM 525 = ATCC 6013]AOZ75971.1 hypothetical protein AQ983_13030 [Clostridium pasteurianum DSM 525 = ATCC 6013]AOZ79767.1 hypothetical protein AQ984_13025 [Clostridium pasteurianum]ELP60047.1 hypothetical protein F502_05407 [Clostridium pasteurianum DSM 525 = ATCC 6013]